jgi:hypothetical protein
MLESYFFVNSLGELQWIKKKYSKILSATTVITTNFEVAAKLRTTNLKCITLSDHLAPSEVENNDGIAWHLVETWGPRGIDELKYDGIPVGRLVSADLLLFFNICLNTKVALEHIFDSNYPKLVYVIRQDTKAMYWDNNGDENKSAANGASQFILEWMCEKKNIPLNRLNYGKKSGIRLKVPGETKSWVNPRRAWNGLWYQNNTALVLDYIIHHNEISTLLCHCSSKSDWRFIGIDFLCEGNISKWPLNQVDIQEQIKTGWECFTRWQSDYSGPYPEIFSNSRLTYQFRALWDETSRIVRRIEIFGIYLETIRPRIVFLGYTAFGAGRCLVAKAHQLGITTASFVHSGLTHYSSYRDRFTGDVDYLLVWGQFHKDMLERQGILGSRIKVVGSLRFSEWYHESIDVRIKKSESECHIRIRYGLPLDKKIVLITTASVQFGVLSLCPLSKHMTTWEKLLILIKKLPKIYFLIKPHPTSDYFSFYTDICNEEIPNLRYIESVNLEQLLPAVDLVLLVNYCTNAALEAMMANIPVVYLQEALYPIEICKGALEENDVMMLNRTEDLEDCLNMILYDQQIYNSHVKRGQMFAIRALGRADPRESVIDTLTEIAQQSQRNPDIELHFSKLSSLARKTLAYLSDGNLQCFQDGILKIFSVGEGSESEKTYLTNAALLMAAIFGCEIGDNDNLQKRLEDVYKTFSTYMTFSTVSKRRMKSLTHLSSALLSYKKGEKLSTLKHFILAFCNCLTLFSDNILLINIVIRTFIGKAGLRVVRHFISIMIRK